MFRVPSSGFFGFWELVVVVVVVVDDNFMMMMLMLTRTMMMATWMIMVQVIRTMFDWCCHGLIEVSRVLKQSLKPKAVSSVPLSVLHSDVGFRV